MNEIFLDRMQKLLKDEYPDYLSAMQKPPYRGFRVNPLKISDERFFELFSFPALKSPFAEHGYYLDSDMAVNRLPGWHAGLFYMQEPSASAVVNAMGIKKGMKVLDLCAAPGSKSTQIAECLGQEGLLVANEIHPKRAGILLENIQRHGITNCIVTSCDTKEIAKQFAGCFDAVLCDAPCSGEGMFRKNPDAEKEWSLRNVEISSARQKEILENAWKALAPGGILMYSTCTLNTEENEENVMWFLDRHPDMELCSVDVNGGRNGFALREGLEKTHRIFPMDHGEGHFMAKFRRKEEDSKGVFFLQKEGKLPEKTAEEIERMIGVQYPHYLWKDHRLYGGTFPFIDTGRIRILSSQVLIGEEKNGRFLFSHHFFTSTYHPFMPTIETEDGEALSYLHGETLNRQCEKEWYAVCWKGYVLGGCRGDGTLLKNKYPKALRIR